MKRLLLLLIVALPMAAGAQSIVASVLASGGNFTTGAGGSLAVTVGQPLVRELTSASNRVHVGFQVGYVASAVTGLEEEIPLSVFPNPVVRQLHIQTDLKSGDFYFELIDLQGRLLPVSHERTAEGAVIDVGSLSPAVYILRIQDKQGRSRHAVIVKTN